MWKCASRTIKTIFHKDFLRCNIVLSTKAPQKKTSNCLLKFSPALVEHINRYYGHYKTSCGKFSKDKKGREGAREGKSSFLGNFQCHVFDALTLCGVVALGYYVLQPFSYTKISSGVNTYENHAFSELSGYQKTVQYLINSVAIKPFNNVLPEVKTPKTKNINEAFPESAESSSENVKIHNHDFIALEKAHQNVLGALSNIMGTQFMKSGEHKEAFEYFKKAAEEENPAGIFNLAICHERGLGTIQNFEKAAELYQRAAKLGHATAMYNLGVFHIQGLGGVELDLDLARELFKAAANLGQTDAEKALNLEKQLLGELPENVLPSSDIRSDTSSFICDSLMQQMSSTDLLDHCKFCAPEIKNAGCDSFEYIYDKEINSIFDSDSGVLDLSPHNESDNLAI